MFTRDHRTLIEIDGCIYDAASFQHSHGFESLDNIGREAFVNHIHISGIDREHQADEIIQAWCSSMASDWPDRVFRIYRHVTDGEIIIRFHVVRPNAINWYEGNEGKVIIIGGDSGNLV